MKENNKTTSIIVQNQKDWGGGPPPPFRETHDAVLQNRKREQYLALYTKLWPGVYKAGGRVNALKIAEPGIQTQWWERKDPIGEKVSRQLQMENRSEKSLMAVPHSGQWKDRLKRTFVSSQLLIVYEIQVKAHCSVVRVSDSQSWGSGLDSLTGPCVVLLSRHFISYCTSWLGCREELQRHGCQAVSVPLLFPSKTSVEWREEPSMHKPSFRKLSCLDLFLGS